MKPSEQLPPDKWLGHWSENGNYQIVLSSNLKSLLDELYETDQFMEIDDIMSNSWIGFRTRKEARLYILKMLRGWRNEIAWAVKDLMDEKKYDEEN